MATGAGGVIIYGIAEAVLPDGARTADRLSPLTDGTLPDRLQDVLDSRGQPAPGRSSCMRSVWLMAASC